MTDHPWLIWTACLLAALCLAMAGLMSLPAPSSIDDCMNYDVRPAIAFFAVFTVAAYFVIASGPQSARLVLLTGVVFVMIAHQFGLDHILRSGWTVCQAVS